MIKRQPICARRNRTHENRVIHENRALAVAAAMASMAALSSFAHFAHADVILQPAVPTFAGWPSSTSGQASFVGTDPAITITPTSASGTVGETLGPELVTGETFTPTSNFDLGAISMDFSGAPADLSLHIYALSAGGVTPTSTGYNLSTQAGPDLLGGGNGLDMHFNGNSGFGLYEMDFTGADQVQLSANTTYTFELWNESTGTVFFQRTNAPAYSGGQLYLIRSQADDNIQEGSPEVRGQVIGGSPRYAVMAIYPAPHIPTPVLQVDINGGGANQLRPNHPGWQAWGNGNTAVLPTNGNGASPSPDGGYPTDTITQSFSASGVASGNINATLRSVDISAGAYAADGAAIDSHDMGAPTNAGSLTYGDIYRDYAFGEIGTSTPNNGTAHRLELSLTGLDPNTPYQLTFYSYDNAVPKAVDVFTDVTANPTTNLPAALANGTFVPGDGTNGTQYAPAGTYVDGSNATGAPTTNSGRAVSFTATSDGSGNLVIDETTVTGLSGATQTNPVLDGFEIALDQRVWTGAGASTNWNDASNWNNQFVPNGLGHSANFGNNSSSTINVDAPTTIGRLNFSGNSLTIAGTSTLTFNDASVNSSLTGSFTGRTQINLIGSSANQTITAPVVLMKDMQVFVANAGQTLTLTNLQPSAVTLSKVGNGTLSVNNVRTNSLIVNQGNVVIQQNGGAAGVSNVGSLNINSPGQLDLNDNDLIVAYTGGSPLATIRSYLVTGYNSGDWTGQGLASTAGHSVAGTGLGYGEATDLGITSLDGQAITGNAVIVKYTYYGDSSLDGKVDLGNDFNLFLQGFLGKGSGWEFGDYNYDGITNTADFQMFVDGFKTQGGPLGELDAVIAASPELTVAQKAALTAVVPEPASLGVLAIGTALAMGRRRRANHA